MGLESSAEPLFSSGQILWSCRPCFDVLTTSVGKRRGCERHYFDVISYRFEVNSEFFRCVDFCAPTGGHLKSWWCRVSKSIKIQNIDFFFYNEKAKLSFDR